MSAEIYSNLNPKIAQHLDARLTTVSNIASLPDPTIPANFLYEGALAYVAGTVKTYYKCVLNTLSTALEWQPFETADLVIGFINITPGTTVLDLSLTSVPISNCYAVEINIVGGTSATLQSIVGIPGSDRLMTFFVKNGQEVIFKHTNYDVASTDQIVLEVGFDMTIKGRIIGNDSLTLKKHGVVNCQWDATQFAKTTEWLQNLLSQTIVNNLTTNDANLPLSAAQGFVLNNLLGGKQQVLIPGNSISLVPGLLSTTISVLPKDWVLVSIPASPNQLTNTLPFITSNIGTSTPVNYYRYVDLRNLPWQSGGNRGLWLLPPGKTPTTSADWVLIDEGKKNTWAGSYTVANQASLASALISNRYYPRIILNSLIGSNNIITNSDGPANEKISIQFPELRSLYKIEYDYILTVSDITSRQFAVDITFTNGVQNAATPLTSGTLQRTIPGSESGGNVSGRQVRLSGSFLLAVASVSNVNDAFNLGIRELTNNFANTSLAATNSSVQISKIG